MRNKVLKMVAEMLMTAKEIIRKFYADDDINTLFENDKEVYFIFHNINSICIDLYRMSAEETLKEDE